MFITFEAVESIRTKTKNEILYNLSTIFIWMRSNLFQNSKTHRCKLTGLIGWIYNIKVGVCKNEKMVDQFILGG